MQQDFFFSYSAELENALQDTCTTNLAHAPAPFLVSNRPEVAAEIHAGEIDFYLDRSRDDLADKVETVRRLYQIRARQLDLALDIEVELTIGNRLLIVGDGVPDSAALARFDLQCVAPDQVTGLHGSIGDFTLTLRVDGTTTSCTADQVVWFDPPQALQKIQGIHDLPSQDGAAIALAAGACCGPLRVTKKVTFDSTRCEIRRNCHSGSC